MSTKVNLKDIGWMYQSPARRSPKETVALPPVSQIPGLGSAVPDGDVDQELERLRKNVFKSSDTPYIILAKQGGRPNLLQFHENPSPATQEPKPYPRCEWYYQEDNYFDDQMVKEEAKEPHVFTLPDYMVGPESAHRSGEGSEGERGNMKAPFAQSTDRRIQEYCKTEGIPEHRPHGYGIRAAKLRAKDLKARSEALQARQREQEKQGAGDPTMMIKLMSNSYAMHADQEVSPAASPMPSVQKKANPSGGVSEKSKSSNTTAKNRSRQK